MGNDWNKPDFCDLGVQAAWGSAFAQAMEDCRPVYDDLDEETVADYVERSKRWADFVAEHAREVSDARSR